MAEALISQILGQLISVTSQQIAENVKSVVSVEKQVEKLTSNLQAIQTVLEDAEKRQVREASVKRWLDKLKDMSYEMEDLLDEWSTAILKSQIDKNKDKVENDDNNDLLLVPKKVSSFPISFLSLNPVSQLSRATHRPGIAKKIKVINGKLDVIAKEKDRYDFNSIRAPQQPDRDRQQTCSFLDVSEIRGRDQDKETLVRKLLILSESGQTQGQQEGNVNNKLHIVSIVGMGGIGKTTLAQLAYNDEEVKAHFDMRIWVCVSDPFDEIRIAKAIVEQVGQSGPSLVELESVLQNMCKSIKERKLLIVLDDVWVEDYKKWEPLKHCLQHGAQGSTILVTTRKERVAQMMGSSCMFQLQNLSEGDTWWLFSQLAFLGRASEECETLEEIGKKIVSKCKGLPLAAKTLGSLMRFRRTKAEWQNVLDSEIWELEEAEKSLLPPLLFSLYDLPSAIRRCFLFCAVFPKDYEIKKDVLIKLWMAQGYLSSSRSREMEVTGQEYFESLAAHSLFQDFIKDDDGSIIQCKMHDIVHDFAQFLTRNECVIMEVDSKKKPSMDAFYKKVRHLTLTCASDAQMPVFNYNAVNSRTLLNLAEDIALPHLFDNLTRLRALDLNAAAIKEVPVKVRNLMHLRYLNLSKNTRLYELPEAVCDLCNLESLILNWCQSLKRLPQGIGKLINLRHLELEETSNLRKFPKGIGKLSSLRTLSKFIVRGDGVKKACNIVLLKNMKHLQGILYLDGLENLISGGESKKAELKNKKNLLGLRLDFYGQKREGGIHDDDDDDDVIEELQPNPNLASLHILYYQGTRLPSWIMMLTNLRELILKNCENCENLPPLGNLPSLELLEIWYMYHVKTMGHRFLGVDAHDKIPNTDDVLPTSTKIAFPKLKRLGFFGLTEWEDWYDWTSWGEDCLIMPRLSCLTIECCPKLKALPHLIQTAPIQVTIRECPILETMLPQGER